jgi:MazG family protein
LIEEVHELDHAIATEDEAAIRREVSDLLLHLAWQLVLAEESGEFTSNDAADDLERKMKRRHPHLFELGPKEPWEILKRREGSRGALDGLPPTLPPLLMALRLGQRAAGVGFDWPDQAGPIAKVREELTEVERALEAGDAAHLEHEIGDLLFAAVNVARKAGVFPDAALEGANRRFRQRFETVERLARERGIEMTEAAMAELDQLWEEAKRDG